MGTAHHVDRIDPPVAADEARTLLGFLDYQRATLRWKCMGLSASQLGTPVAPTTLTLGGLLKHLAVVEAGWVNQTFAGGIVKPSWFDELDHDDPDWSFTSAAGVSPEQLFAWLDESIAVSDRVIADALAGPDGLGSLSVGVEDGRPISLRWIICHLIEEYARHNGHADLLREAIDGSTGE
ncbi:MAG: DinB family protein [Actinomycetota bacterium]|nr:DinB family protein [Actinomycetota bacterium]